MKNLLALLIPTNKPDEFRDKFMTCLPMFSPIKDYILFCFNFQPPWNNDLINRTVQRLKQNNFNVCYCFNDYRWTPETFSFVTMRNDAAQLANQDFLFFADYDDDICIEDSEYGLKVWINSLIYLLKNQNYGSLRIDRVYDGFAGAGGAFHKNSIYTIFSRNNRTGLGLIYKNLYNGNVLPDPQLKLLGCQEDHLQIMQRAKDGYLHAIIRAPFGYHTDYKPVKSRVTYGLEPLMDRPNSVTTYIRKTYDEIDYEPYGKTIETWLDYEQKIDMNKPVNLLLSELAEAYEAATRKH